MASTIIKVEIELSEEEAAKFEEIIDKGCYDINKYLRRLIRMDIKYRGLHPKKEF